MSKRPGIVEVTWFDHSGPWPKGSKPKLIKRRTVGYLISRDDDPAVQIAGTWDGKRSFDDITIIAKVMVRGAIYLVVP